MVPSEHLQSILSFGPCPIFVPYLYQNATAIVIAGILFLGASPVLFRVVKRRVRKPNRRLSMFQVRNVLVRLSLVIGASSLVLMTTLYLLYPGNCHGSLFVR